MNELFFMKKSFLLGIFFALFGGSFLFASPVLAQEEMNMEEGSVEVTVESISPDQQQAELQRIAQELDEIENEVNTLSLAVNKVVLEKQALALEEQVQERIAAMTQPESTSEGTRTTEAQEGSETAIAEETEGQEQQPAPSAPVANQEEDDVFRNLSIDSEEGTSSAPVLSAENEDDETSGFLAALGPIGNLGTPEIVTLLILAVLAIFVIARRVAVRGGRKAKDRAKAASPASQQVLNEQREDLQERVAWK